MLSSTAGARAMRCLHCRTSLLQSFLSPYLAAPVTLKHASSHHVERGQTRSLSTSPLRRFEQATSPPHAAAAQNDPDKETVNPFTTPPAAPPQPPSLPWYLRAQPPPSAAPSLSHRAHLPSLPPLSPPILQPLLEHIYLDIGLDRLSLLDLRALDPPPALGANLLMLLGTARSEKHLHVSADRLCRWLRGAHGLRPYADGLLGRNELKIRLRRKAKRARLTTRFGAPEAAGGADDGIRTGWVCVNVGRVPGGEGEIWGGGRGEGVEEGWVGFGGEAAGVRVVVQMFTEEKREELDLESLWGGVLRRNWGRRVEEGGSVEGAERSGEESLAAEHAAEAMAG